MYTRAARTTRRRIRRCVAAGQLMLHLLNALLFLERTLSDGAVSTSSQVVISVGGTMMVTAVVGYF